MTLEQFAMLQPGDVVFVVGPILGLSRVFPAHEIIFERAVTKVHRGTMQGHEHGNAIAFDANQGARYHQVRDCFLTRDEAMREAVGRIDAIIGGVSSNGTENWNKGREKPFCRDLNVDGPPE